MVRFAFPSRVISTRIRAALPVLRVREGEVGEILLPVEHDLLGVHDRFAVLQDRPVRAHDRASRGVVHLDHGVESVVLRTERLGRVDRLAALVVLRQRHRTKIGGAELELARGQHRQR